MALGLGGRKRALEVAEGAASAIDSVSRDAWDIAVEAAVGASLPPDAVKGLVERAQAELEGAAGACRTLAGAARSFGFGNSVRACAAEAARAVDQAAERTFDPMSVNAVEGHDQEAYRAVAQARAHVASRLDSVSRALSEIASPGGRG